jgi:hypothetical protein
MGDKYYAKKDDKFVEAAEGNIRFVPLWKWLLEKT